MFPGKISLYTVGAFRFPVVGRLHTKTLPQLEIGCIVVTVTVTDMGSQNKVHWILAQGGRRRLVKRVAVEVMSLNRRVAREIKAKPCRLQSTIWNMEYAIWKYNDHIYTQCTAYEQWVLYIMYATYMFTTHDHCSLQLQILLYVHATTHCKKGIKSAMKSPVERVSNKNGCSHLVSQWMAVSTSTEGTMLKKCAMTSVRCSVCTEKDKRARWTRYLHLCVCAPEQRTRSKRQYIPSNQRLLLRNGVCCSCWKIWHILAH